MTDGLLRFHQEDIIEEILGIEISMIIIIYYK
jgi:hypothetical protein